MVRQSPKAVKASLFSSKDGRTIEQEQELKAHWFQTGNVIRQIVVNPFQPSEIIIGSEDRYAYGLDHQTNEPLWKFKTNGGVRALHCSDINGDGEAEILVGSADRFLYLLNRQGQYIDQYSIDYPIHKIFVEDIDGDGENEILVASDNKELIALTYLERQETKESFVKKWRSYFDKRIPCTLCNRY